MPDIESRKDLEIIVSAFYEKAIHDDLIGVYFTQVVKLNLKRHLPIIVDFWDSLIFHKNTYKRNTMLSHLALNQKHPFKKEHFNRWLLLWDQTVSSLYEGKNATIALMKAKQISLLMQFKMKITNS